MLIYEPRGQAREYAPLACNVYRGCDHGCTYCYAPKALYMTQEAFHCPQLRGGDFLRKLAKEAHKMWLACKSGQVLLSFTCDPYQTFDKKHQVTRRAIEILHKNDLDVQILTKGGLRALRDIDLLTSRDAFATTMTLLDEQASQEWEPNAATPAERIYAMNRMHTLGIPTWVSLEPVLDPDAALEIIRQTHTFVDLYKVGKVNYHPLAMTIDWAQFAREVVVLLDSLDCRYYIKNSLRPFLPDLPKQDPDDFQPKRKRPKLQPTLLQC